MENLFKVDEYSGSLPNPVRFPVQGIEIVSISDNPCMFSNGYLLDLHVCDDDIEMLERKLIRRVSYSLVNTIIEGAKEATLLLTEPVFVYNLPLMSYIVYTPENYPLALQVKYYKYFRNRYKKCQFYSKENGISLISVKLDSELVGIFMPLFLWDVTIKELKEKRK